MTGFLATIASVSPTAELFNVAGTPITAGHIRATAAAICDDIAHLATPILLHTQSAALFSAGLLAAAHLRRQLVCPAHLQPDYLQEIGIDQSVLLTDLSVEIPGTRKISLATDGDAQFASLRENLDIIFYTSGVTGAPKPVKKAIVQLDAEAAELEHLWGKEAGAVFSTVSHQHIYGMLFRVFWPVQSGRVSADRAVEYLEQLAGKLTPGTTLVTSPAHLTRLPPPASLTGLYPKLIFSSGAPLIYAAAQNVKTVLGALPLEVLGSTETGGIGWRQQHDQEQAWMPFPSVQVSIDDNGCLTVNSPFTGEPGPVRTDDLAVGSAAGFRLRGRVDRIVKIEGKRVSLTRVEEALLSLSLVAGAAAIDLPSRKGGLGVIVELNKAGQAALAADGAFRLSRALRNELASRLEPAERPKHWRFEPIPRNAQGKSIQVRIRAAFPDSGENVLGRKGIMSLGDDSAVIALELVPDMTWFKGHFPGQPILPGVAQVHMAVSWAQELWHWRPSSGNLLQLKFRHVLRPGDLVHLEIEREPSRSRLKFAFRLGDTVASEGIIGGTI